jgi:hypothetical protein
MFSAVPRASSPVFMFCAPGHVFDGTEGVESRFHVLCALTRFRRKRGCRVPFSCFPLPESFPAVPRASGPVFKFCAPGLVIGGTAGIGSRFHVLCNRTRFRRYQGRRLSFSCFARRTRFRRYRGCRVQFSCFPLLESFLAVPGASGPVFMFCAPGLVFDDTEGAGSRFHVLRSQSRFLRYQGRRVPFSCFALPDSFSAVPRSSGPVFMFCAPILVFGDTEGVSSRIHVLCPQTRFRHYRGLQLPFSCFTCLDSFSMIPSASGPVFMFCAPGHVFGGDDCVGSRYLVLHARTHFRRSSGRRVPISCFALPDTLSV